MGRFTILDRALLSQISSIIEFGRLFILFKLLYEQYNIVIESGKIGKPVNRLLEQ